MNDKRSIRNARAEMEAAGRKTERSAAGEPKQPGRYKVYDKIRDRVSLRTVDIVIAVTALLIVGLLIYGIATGDLQK